MKRWGLLGLLALLACGEEEVVEEITTPQVQVCPGVVAGALPGAEPAQEAVSPEVRTGADGRQRYIVRFREALPVGPLRVADDSGLGGQIHAVYRHVPAAVMDLTPEERTELAQDPDVVSIDPDLPRRALGLPTPSASALLSAAVQSGSVAEYTQGLRMVEAPAVWDKNQDGVLDEQEPTGEGITVCVIDSGIDPDHPELKAAYHGGWDFVEGDDAPWDQNEAHWGGGHGTHVAGTIAAQLSSGAANVGPGMSPNGVVGVAPGTRLLIARVLDTRGVAWVSDIIAALEWCHGQGANIATLSLGGSSSTRVEREAFESVSAKGMLVIAAAGNNGIYVEYPASYPSVLAVGAVDTAMRRAPFSSRGENLALMAPGISVLSSFIRNQGTISQVELGGIPHASLPLHLAPAGTYTGRIVDCREGSTLSSCRLATCEGFVAYVDRNDRVPLQSQLLNVMRQGARALIIGDKEGETVLSDLSIGRRGNWVPAALVSHEAGVLMRRMAGLNTHVTLHRSDYTMASGTSMATPHVTGVAALVWSRRPSLTAVQVRALLQSTAKDLGPTGWDPDYGYGMVQAAAALQALEDLP
jgi:subtilisin family serine protease